MRPTLPLLLCSILLSSTALSATDPHKHDSKHSDHQGSDESSQTTEAHVHGVARLMVASEDTTLEIHFKSPAANLLGFEYRAKTEDEKAAVSKTEQLLKEPDRLFVLNGAGCELDQITLDLGQDATAAHGKDEHDEHDEHDTHSELFARYTYTCDTLTKMTSIDVHLFKQFQGIETIHGIWVTEQKQGAQKLTKDQATLLVQ